VRAGGPHCAAFAIISIRRRDCRNADGEPHVIASRRAQRRGVVQPAFVTQMGMRKLPLVLLVPLPSKLRGKSIPTRCSAPVRGLRMGSPIERTKPRTSSRARRASKSTLSEKHGLCLVAHMVLKTHHTVAMSSVSSPDRCRYRASGGGATTSPRRVSMDQALQLNWCNVPESPCHWRSFGSDHWLPLLLAKSMLGNWNAAWAAAPSTRVRFPA
jgi:hypothetical protein